MSDNFRFFIVVAFVVSSLGWMGLWSWQGIVEAAEVDGRRGSWAAVSWQERVEKWRDAGRHGPRPRCY
jgi:hypothetical protein